MAYHVKWIEANTRKESREGLFYLGDEPKKWESLIYAMLFADEEHKINTDRWRNRSMSYQVIDIASGDVAYDTLHS